MSDDASNIPPGPTPTGYQRTQGGGFKWVPPTPEQLARLLPQYDIECLLGRGGMGAVYKGTQKSLGRPVAIKILPPEVDDEDTSYTARFKNEARIMARLSHPGIVAVFDFGETSDGQLYIVMEYIDGSDVAKMVLSQGKLPPEHALAITAHVCDALGYAHANGIIHRDIKPANILINMDGAVKVADFGLAKLDDPGTSGLTKSGMAMGTPDFVAPETLMLGTQADGRADLYAVGVMLYQMLTGQLPRGAFDLPSVISGTDRRFDAIVMKAMKYDRAERYQSSAEIRRDLDVILTAPLIESGGESSAAIPKQSLPQKPVARGPQQKAGAAAPKQKAEIGKQSRVPETGGAKSKTPLFIGISVAAALAIGAFVIFGGGKPDVARLSKIESATPQTATAPNLEVRATPAAPVKTRDEPKPAPVVVSSPPKPETPKPAPVKKEESKPVTAAAPAMPATPPTPSAPVPASSPPPPPLSALDQRLTALDTGFQAAVERDAGAAFKANIAALDKLYLTALDRALATATSGGKLEEAIALREEKQRIEQGQGVPSEVEESTLAVQPPATLKSLRQTYRSTTAQHEATKLKAMQPLYDKYDQALAAVQTELTKANQLDDAMRVKTVREQVAATRGSGVVTPPAAASQPSAALAGASAPPSASLFAASKDKPFTNSLGMKFVPVPETDILICIHETRRQDYAAYVAENPRVNDGWKKQFIDDIPADQLDSHPVVSVTWDEAVAYCAWLSKKEGKTYRLPTDKEWSYAVGIGHKESWNKGATPQDRHKDPQGEYPWEGNYPPKTKDLAGNYADMALKAKSPDSNIIDGYNDGFPFTAPVMSFKPNKLGIYDLGGNVFEWCDDWYDAAQTMRTVRSSSYLRTDGDIASHFRPGNGQPTTRTNNTGFRIVVDTRAPASPSGVAAKPANVTPMPPATPAPTPATAAKSDFTNSLGMKFVKVSGTDVLMCIHETRKKDYVPFANETPGLGEKWKNAEADGMRVSDGDDHPVVNVSWEDAAAYCAWLSKKEGRAYRLPTDKEWSFAVGTGRDEKFTKDATPESLSNKIPDYPWGTTWPPPKNAANLADMTWKAKKPDTSFFIDGYQDGFETTAPVMSFKPNKLGIFDLIGNAAEWCEEWYNAEQSSRVGRGGAWSSWSADEARSTRRFRYAYVSNSNGFRLVVDLKAPSAKPPGGPGLPPQRPPPPPPTSGSAPKSDFTNSLGMKFIKISGTKVMFCIHETRYKDYAAFAAAVPNMDVRWKNQNLKNVAPKGLTDDHPVVIVSWEDAQAFCVWLSQKEGKRYRLPTDEEWSYAVGIGRDEKRKKGDTPGTIAAVPNEYPWGTKWPPSKGCENYGDESYNAAISVPKYLTGYDDGYPTTAPVMSFKPNRYGLYDMGGNVSEWCEEWLNNTQTSRVLRGSSWKGGANDFELLSSARGQAGITVREDQYGFRIVVETTD